MSVYSKPFNQPLGCFGFCSNGQMVSGHNRLTRHLQSPPQNGLTQVYQKQKQELDDLLSQAMSKLSFEERQKEQEVLHGVHQVVEDDDFMDHALQHLDDHLSCNKQGSVYEVAERMDPEYVQAKPFRIMFLRANEYDPKSSADQMMRFFEMKHGIFGRDKLTKDITLADFDEDDIACLKAGSFQLAGLDRSGRQVFVTFGGLLGSANLKSWLRVQYYVKMKSLMDAEETQVRGVVAVWCAIGDGLKSRTNDGNGYIEKFKAARTVPQKVVGIHICVDELHQALLCNAMIKLMKGNMRARVRVHCGSAMECQYQLSTFGILPHSLPLDSNGRMNLNNHLNWIHSCAMEDKPIHKTLASTTVDGAILVDTTNNNVSPGPNDVLFTCGKVKNHAGTQRFQGLVKDYSTEYDSATDETKRRISNEIIERIQASGGRFLKHARNNPATSYWEEVPVGQVRKKVMQTFRNRRRVDAPKQKTNTTGIGTLIDGEPLLNDVVFGRRIKRNAGTELLHRLIKDHQEEYDTLDRGVKMKFVEAKIMQKIIAQGGRFLVQPPEEEKAGRWLELSHEKARGRISKSFRDHRRGSKKKAPVVG